MTREDPLLFREEQQRIKSFFCQKHGSGLPAHGISQTVGDGPLEYPGGVTVEGFQRGGGQTAGGVAAHGEVHVENELHLRVLRRVGNVGLQAADTGVDLGGAAGIQLELRVAGAVDDPVLRQIGFRHGAQIGRRE